MPIIYLCQTGTYFSLIAANLHIGKLSKYSDEKDILHLPYFASKPDYLGRFIFVGKDEFGNHIYTLSTGCEAKLIIKSAIDLLRINEINKQILFVNVSEIITNQNFWFNSLVKKIPNHKSLLVKKIVKNLSQINSKVEEIKKSCKTGTN